MEAGRSQRVEEDTMGESVKVIRAKGRGNGFSAGGLSSNHN